MKRYPQKRRKWWLYWPYFELWRSRVVRFPELQRWLRHSFYRPNMWHWHRMIRIRRGWRKWQGLLGGRGASDA